MAKINSYRRRWLRYHKGYEKRAYKVFKAVFKKWSKDIPLDEMTIFNYPEVLDRSIDVEDMFKAYEEVYLNVGLMHGRRLKKEVQEKFFDLDDFPTIFKEFIQNWLRTNAADNIVSIARTFKSEIRQILTQGIQDGKTIQELTTDLNKMLRRPGWYRWQSARIARTETTTSANLATIKQAELLPYYADKLWISGSDARVRRFPVAKYDHLQMNGKKAGLADYFEVPNTEIGFKGQLLYPGDPIGRAGNIINCRCTIGIVGKRDKNGMLIMKQGGSPTISAPLPKPIPKPTTFTPAKTIAEAEQWAIKNGINPKGYNKLNLKTINETHKGINDVKLKLKADIKLDFNELSIEDNYDLVGNAHGNKISVDSKKWNNEYLNKLNKGLREQKKSILKRIAKLEEEMSWSDWDNPRLKKEIAFNRNWLKELEGNYEFSNVTYNVRSATHHELGHKIQRWLNSNSKYTDEFIASMDDFNADNRNRLVWKLDEIARKEGYKLGQYATRNDVEYFAESWSAYMSGKHSLINPKLLKIFKLITR